VDRTRGGDRTVVVEQPAEVAALDQPHVEEQPAVDLTEVVDRDDVRFLEAGRDLLLLAEPGHAFGVQQARRGEELVEGDVPLMAAVEGAVHDAHAAGADLFVEHVGAELLRGHPGAPRDVRAQRQAHDARSVVDVRSPEPTSPSPVGPGAHAEERTTLDRAPSRESR
jgi:hypothetical protein